MASSEEETQTATVQKSEPQDITPSELSTRQQDLNEPAASTPVEMSTLESKKTPPDPTSGPATTADATASNPSIENSNSPGNESRSPVSPLNSREQEQADSSPSNTDPPPMARQTSTAIGPSSDQPMSLPKDAERSGPTLMITLLLTNGARHPFKLDSRYLQKRNVKVTNDDPFNISVYTLKELILREWRDEWEAKPSSPGAIRLISFGKLLDDKAPLRECKFNLEAPNVLHMTIKPQEIIDEEENAKSGKGGFGPGSGRDSGDRTPGCRCIIL